MPVVDQGTFEVRSGSWDPSSLAVFIAELQALKKYATLNYIAVYKAVKKRNRHLADAEGSSNSSGIGHRDAVALLQEQKFFTSGRLAALVTRAEVLQAELQGSHTSRGVTAMEEYTCAICLGTLNNPVVLTCAHRFCWGCIVTDAAHRASSSVSNGSPDCSKADKEHHHHHDDRLLHYAASGFEASRPYECPCCRRVQFLHIAQLEVDPHLSKFVSDLNNGTSSDAAALNVDAKPFVPAQLLIETEAPPSQATTDIEMPLAPKPDDSSIAVSAKDNSQAPAAPAALVLPAAVEKPLLPPCDPGAGHKMTVVLDMDGTLLSSYSAKRRPRLPLSLNTFVTGKGGKLNPGGVLVVERPGLRRFLEELSSFAEVVLFTAGLPEYADPIIQHLDPDGRIFRHRLFREATVKSDHYPCVKDLSRLGRDLSRTVLVDDTPLAFLNQPTNGIPVYAFRSDPDDRFLCEAVLPFLESLSLAPDVRPLVAKRFSMTQWFTSNGFSPQESISEDSSADCCKGGNAVEARDSSAAVADEARDSSAPTSAALDSTRIHSSIRGSNSNNKMLLLLDFDNTVTTANANEALFGNLVPELLPLLDGIEPSESAVPAINNILTQMQLRGVSRDTLVAALRDLGQRIVPEAAVRAVKLAGRLGADVSILSDCNTLFVSHILNGAKIRPLVKEIISNGASFERLGVESDPAPSSAPSSSQQWGAVSNKAGTHRLVVSPRHDKSGNGCSHSCPLCPSNLCKGQELLQLRSNMGYGRVVFCGNSATDICPALQLQEGDFVCARKGQDLESLVRERRAEIKATVLVWEDHQELLQLIQTALRERRSLDDSSSRHCS